MGTTVPTTTRAERAELRRTARQQLASARQAHAAGNLAAAVELARAAASAAHRADPHIHPDPDAPRAAAG